MTVQDILNLYMTDDNYIVNSMIVKSSNSIGCTYKWLYSSPCCNNTEIKNAFRRELYIATEPGEILEERTVITSVEVFPAV